MDDYIFEAYSDEELIDLYEQHQLNYITDEHLFEELCWRAGLYVEYNASDDFFRLPLANRAYHIIKEGLDA